MQLNEILAIGVKAKGSDIHIKTGLPPIVRIDGKLHPIPNAPRLTPDGVSGMVGVWSAAVTGKAGPLKHCCCSSPL